jgi:hypothetical protein
MPDQQTNTPPQAPAFLTFLRTAGIAVFAIATVIALFLLWRQQASNVQKLWMVVGWLMACGAVAMSYMTAIRNRGRPLQAVPAIVIFDVVCFIVSGLVVVSFYSFSNALNWAAAMIWSFACLALGGIAGFLFGIPRSRSRGQRQAGPAAGANPQGALANHPQPAPETSTEGSANGGDESPIEQISDWLTKIIVGLGLANLKDLPVQLDRWANYVAPALSAPGAALSPASSFALGLILYFLILGFLSCYVLTQMFLLSFINRVRGT